MKRFSYIVFILIYSLSGLTCFSGFAKVSLFDTSAVSRKLPRPVQLSNTTFRLPRHIIPSTNDETASVRAALTKVGIVDLEMLECIACLNDQKPQAPAQTYPANKAPPTI